MCTCGRVHMNNNLFFCRINKRYSIQNCGTHTHIREPHAGEIRRKRKKQPMRVKTNLIWIKNCAYSPINNQPEYMYARASFPLKKLCCAWSFVKHVETGDLFSHCNINWFSVNKMFVSVWSKQAKRKKTNTCQLTIKDLANKSSWNPDLPAIVYCVHWYNSNQTSNWIVQFDYTFTPSSSIDFLW